MANENITLLESDGVTETTVKVLDVGRQAAASSKSLTLSTEDKAVIDAIAASVAAALAAGENHIGEVGGNSPVRAITMTTDTGIYASGELIADSQQYDAFFRKVDGTAIINTISIVEKDAQGVAYYVIFLSASTSLGSENSTPNISDANIAANFQGIVAVAASDFVTVSGAKVATIRNIGLPVKAVSGTDDLYIAILNGTGTPTYASGEIQLKIGALLD
jgi:hypothetical protein